MARSVRPWNAYSKTTTPGRPVAARAIFTAFSMPSAPEFTSSERCSPPARRELAEAPADLDVRLVGADDEALMQVALGLLLHGLDDRRVPVANVLAADASCEVDERATVDVGDARSSACATTRRGVRLRGRRSGHGPPRFAPTGRPPSPTCGDYAPTQAGFQRVRERTRMLRGVRPLPSGYAGVAQLVEQVICNH